MRTLALISICAAFAAVGYFEARKRQGEGTTSAVIGAVIGLCLWTYLAYYTTLFHR